MRERPMATRASIVSSSLGDQLNCAVCLERFADPRTLPCHHSFCLRCLRGVPHQQEEDCALIQCPTCRKSSRLPEGGTEQLSKAFLINNLLELQNQAEHDQQVCVRSRIRITNWKCIRIHVLVLLWCAKLENHYLLYAGRLSLV